MKNKTNKRRILEEYEANELGVPFKVILRNGVVEEIDAISGERYTAIPNFDGLIAAIAVLRCGMYCNKLRGDELRFLRKTLEMQAKELADILCVTPETYSRWENDQRPISESAERLIRIYTWTRFRDIVPAFQIEPENIIQMGLRSVWTEDKPLVMELELKKSVDKAASTSSDEWFERDAA